MNTKIGTSLRLPSDVLEKIESSIDAVKRRYPRLDITKTDIIELALARLFASGSDTEIANRVFDFYVHGQLENPAGPANPEVIDEVKKGHNTSAKKEKRGGKIRGQAMLGGTPAAQIPQSFAG